MNLFRIGFRTSAVLFPLVLAACSGGNGQTAAKDAKAETVNAIPVEVAAAKRSEISASFNGTATLSADHEALVAAKASGVLKRLYVEEGQTVKEGQLLAELEDASARSQLAQAEAQIQKADSTFAYGEQSMTKQLISKREYDQAKFDRQNLRAAYETARLQLEFTRIVAPVAGVIAERSVKLGNLVQINQSLFRIVGMDPLQTVLNVPERQLGILKAGQQVSLEADALPGKKFEGTILRIAPVVDAASGTFRVTCEFHDKSGQLKPGMFTRVEIVYDQRNDALTVPRSALLEEDGETAVFVVDAAKSAASQAVAPKSSATPAPSTTEKVEKAAPGFVAHRKLVKVGYADSDKVEIRSGINEGDLVITVGRNAVRDGTAVQMLGVDKVAADKAATGVKG